jgi:hypothetical protein
LGNRRLQPLARLKRPAQRPARCSSRRHRAKADEAGGRWNPRGPAPMVALSPPKDRVRAAKAGGYRTNRPRPLLATCKAKARVAKVGDCKTSQLRQAPAKRKPKAAVLVASRSMVRAPIKASRGRDKAKSRARDRVAGARKGRRNPLLQLRRKANLA